MKDRLLRGMGALLALSLATTIALLLAEGRVWEALPLHLCSLAALAALVIAFSFRAALLDFLWYLGMPGALLALLFPAPEVCRFQFLLNLSYLVTHALIVLIPAVCMLGGRLPRPGKTARMMLSLLGIAAAAFWVNKTLGTDFLFLAAPPAGTPLETVFALGYPLYLAALLSMMLFLCLIMDGLAHILRRLSVQ